MDEDKLERIQSLNQSETEVLRILFDDPNFRVREVAREIHRGEGGIRTNLTAIFTKLGVPSDVVNKRGWVFREYSEEYEYLFQREEWEAKQASQRLGSQPEIYIKPPDPVMADTELDPLPVQIPSELSRGLEGELEEAIEKLNNLYKNTVVMDLDDLIKLARPRRMVRLWVFLVFVFLAFVVGLWLGLVAVP